MNIEGKIQKNIAAKRRTAILFGILAGFDYSLLAWGIDSYRLAQSHAILAWLQFGVGFLLTGVIGAAAGYISYRFNHIFTTFLLWLGAGLAFSWIGGHMPFQINSAALKLLSPEIAAQVQYPYIEAARGHQLLITLAVTGITVLAGMLSTTQIENAAEGSGVLGFILPVLIWLVMFGIAGYVVRDNLTQKLADPVVGANNLIQFALDNEGKTVDRQTALELHLRSLDPILPLLHRPRRLILAGYDDWISFMDVLIDFNGEWVSCSVMNGLVNYCEVR